MKQAEVIGVARVVMHTKERLAALIPDGDALLMNTIRWAEELRPRDEIDFPAKSGAVKESELKMASQLIKEMTVPWKPEEFSDKFTTAIHALAAQRVAAGKTEKVTALEDEAPAASNVVDLTELLRQSLGAKKPGAKGGAKGSDADAPAPAKKAAAKKTSRKKAA
jgi:DNA end-binding protein Ku